SRRRRRRRRGRPSRPRASPIRGAPARDRARALAIAVRRRGGSLVSAVRRWSVLLPLTLVPALLGCRSASEGHAGADVAEVAADGARTCGGAARPSAAPPPYGCAAGGLAPACAGLLAMPLTIESAVKIALLNNRSVREAYERVGIARADLLQAGLISNPVFTANAKFFSKGPEIELSLLQSFVELFFVPMRRCVAAADLAAAQASVARELVHLVYDVRRGFVLVQSSRALTQSRREVLKTETTQRDLIRSLHEAGNVLDSQWTLAQTSALRAELDVTAAEAVERDARETINVL